MNTVPVVYASDSSYVLPTIVSITSLLTNKSKDTFYRIFIIGEKLSKEDKDKFLWERHKDDYELRFLSLELKEPELARSSGTWPVNIYAKYFICDLLEDYDKCLWLDGDTIILSDLSELFSVDLQDNCLGAVKSPGTNYNVAAGKHPVLERSKCQLKCINVGMLLLNLKALRETGGGAYFMRETLSSISALSPETPVTEQDIFNKLLAGRIEYLPLKYNLYVDDKNFIDRPYYPFCFDRNTMEEAFLNPVIIHYTVPEKPWKYADAEKVYAHPFKTYRNLWDFYYKLSPLSSLRLRRKRVPLARRLWWFFLRPILKGSPFLLKLKRKICNTKIKSPIHDLFD
jgi:lipopolysaccharide biosynthesis glycosyltransferase